MGDAITIEDLARWSGEDVEELRSWRALGLLPHDGGPLALGDVERVRLIRFALARGYTAERLAETAARRGDMIHSFVESFGAPSERPVATAAEAATRAGIDPDVFERLRSAAGLRDQGYVYGEDVDAIHLMKAALDGGLPVDVLAQILRVLADATGKMADSTSRLFHLYVHEPLRAAGAGGDELLQQTNAVGIPLLELVEPAVVYFHRKAWSEAFAEDMMLHLAEEATAPSEVLGEFPRAFLFVDLSGFTPMTEVMGDEAAAQVIARFAELVRDATARCSGQVVKQIGDEFMLVFPDGGAAAMCGLEIQAQAAAEPRFLALRLGAHFGTVLYREGDYVGTAVNTAARVAAAATRHQFLVTGAVLDHLGGLDVDVVPVGARSLRGLSDEVALFELRRPGVRAAKVADPVCGMELDERSSEAQLHWEDRRLLFCSEACLRRFLEDPDRYRTGGT